MKSASRLEKVLTAGKFAVTAELGPPQSADPEAITKKAEYFRGNVDGANITDNQTAIVRMSSIAAGVIALSCGVEPVVQMVCRDRNRLAMQSDILGAAALGIKNLLCLFPLLVRVNSIEQLIDNYFERLAVSGLLDLLPVFIFYLPNYSISS